MGFIYQWAPHIVTFRSLAIRS